MKYKRIIFISLLLSLIGLMCLFAFAEKEALPIITWDRTFGGRDDDGAESLIQTTDSGYVVAGETSSKGAGEKDLWVIKLDHQGDMIWDRTYGGSDEDRAYSLIQTTDGGYAVAGATLSKGAGSADLWVIKLDHQGDMIWDRTYGGSDDDYALSLIQTTDGGYAVAGLTDSKGAGKSDFWVIKLDHQGDMIWDRTCGGSDIDGAYSLIQTTDGGYTVAGWTSSKGAGKLDFWVIKLDHQGNTIWDRTYGGNGYDWAESLIQTTDGGYTVAGMTNSKGAGSADFWVIKLDHQGNMVWDRTYGGSDEDRAYSLIQTTDGGYAVAGLTGSKGAVDADFWIIKLDHQGNTIWDRTYGGSDEDRAYSLIQTTDGGYAVAGATLSKGSGKSDFWVIKLDVQGKSPEKIDTQNTGAINLTSTPSSAKVFLDTGQYMGKTTLMIDKVSPGKHKVTLDLADYEKYVQEVDVIAGKVVDVSATLVATRIQPTSRIWSLEGRFIDFSSICEISNRRPKLLVPQSVTYYSNIERTITGCLTLDEKLLSQQPLVIIIKIHNSTNVGQALKLPLLSDFIVHTQTDSKSALAFYYPWGSVDLRGWVTKAKGKIEVQVKAGTAMELLYLIPRFNGKAKIELLNIGSFEINEPK